MVCELDGNHRAARDPGWAQLLARVRVGDHTDEDIAALEDCASRGCPTLCYTGIGPQCQQPDA
eukprot:1133862-Amphidinium_carterae.1